MQLFDIELDNLDLQTIGQWPKAIRMVVCLLIFLSLSYFGYHCVLEDHLKNYETIYTERLKKQDDFEKTYPMVVSKDDYEQQLLTLKNKQDQVNLRLSPPSLEAEFLETLAEQATLKGLQIKGITPLPEEHKKRYCVRPLTLYLTGSYHALGHYVAVLINEPRLLSLGDFTLQQGKDHNALDITLLIKHYVACVSASDEEISGESSDEDQ